MLALFASSRLIRIAALALGILVLVSIPAFFLAHAQSEEPIDAAVPEAQTNEAATPIAENVSNTASTTEEAAPVEETLPVDEEAGPEKAPDAVPTEVATPDEETPLAEPEDAPIATTIDLAPPSVEVPPMQATYVMGTVISFSASTLKLNAHIQSDPNSDGVVSISVGASVPVQAGSLVTDTDALVPDATVRVRVDDDGLGHMRARYITYISGPEFLGT